MLFFDNYSNLQLPAVDFHLFVDCRCWAEKARRSPRNTALCRRPGIRTLAPSFISWNASSNYSQFSKAAIKKWCVKLSIWIRLQEKENRKKLIIIKQDENWKDLLLKNRYSIFPNCQLTWLVKNQSGSSMLSPLTNRGASSNSSRSSGVCR